MTMRHETETRITAQAPECRSTAVHPRIIQGYAAVFASRSQPLGHQGVIERVSPSFFNKSKGDGWPGVTARYDHKSEFILASTRSHTLELTIDGTGLRYVAELPESRSDIYELVDRGDVAGSSFSFNCVEDDWEYRDGETCRTLVSGKLLDVGPTSTPAYQDSSVAVLRSLSAYVNADLDEVTADFRNGNLARYFTRTDNVQSAPTPLAVAQRSEPSADDGLMDLRRRKLELWRRKLSWDEPTMDTRRARLKLWERKIRMDDEELGIVREARSRDTVEAQSLTARRDDHGNAIDWHAAQQ
jgi:HK97 family phage prohead protease